MFMFINNHVKFIILYNILHNNCAIKSSKIYIEQCRKSKELWLCTKNTNTMYKPGFLR